MANAITIGRLVLLFVVVAMIYFGNVQMITLCMLLLLLVIAADGIDGWVARKRNETSTFGAVFDIAGDRIVENTLWIVFSDLGLIPVWVPILVISRGFIVDGLRALSMQEGMTAFGEKNMMRSPLTTWLTAGRFMRGFFGYAKALAFVFLCGLQGWEHHDTTGTFLGSLYSMDWYRYLGWGLVWLAVALTVIRGIPVVIDGLAYVRELDARKRGEAS